MREAVSSDFSPSYFLPEAREGFYVSDMMKRYWAAQIKVLSVMDEICIRHDIPYFAYGGTLIGTVRHGGYIPWDDDFDICMMRQDLNRFLEAADRELPQGFRILDLHREPEYALYLPRIVNTRHIDYSPAFLRDYYGCPYSAGVDIVPLDGMYEDEEREETRRKKALEAMRAAERAASCGDLKGCKSKMLLAEELFAACDAGSAREVAMMPFWAERHSFRFRKEWFEEMRFMPYEQTKIPVPAGYDALLRNIYGDYTRIVKGTGIHDYPVYREQERVFREKTGTYPWRYTFSRAHLTSPRTPAPLKGPESRKEIVFLAVRADWWKSMEPFYREMCADEGNHVTLMALPYLEAGPDGSNPQIRKEQGCFPDTLSFTDLSSYDFGARRPDMIVIQHPYDGESNAVMLPDFFFAARLRQFTDCLVYIPCHDLYTPDETDETAREALRVLIEQPAVFQADVILLPTEGMRRLYIRTLCEIAGEDTRARWERIIRVKTD